MFAERIQRIVFILALNAVAGAFVFASAAEATPQAAQEKSPAQLDWEAKLGPNQVGQPGFGFVVEDPNLPRVLLIGDSISIGYTDATRALLQGKANVLRIPTNGGPTSRGLEFLSQWLGNGKWDVIHFNWGLHDLKRLKDGKMDISAEWQVSAEQYEKNLDTLVQQLKATGARLIWASTTPVPEGANGRITGDEVKANAIAEGIMKKYGVPIDDLYARVLPVLSQKQNPRDVHFTKEGSAFLAEAVAANITQALDAPSWPPAPQK